MFGRFGRQHFISNACVIFSSSVVNVRNSLVYRNMEVLRERISFKSNLRDVFLSLHIGFSFVRATVAYVLFERTSGFEPSSKTIAPKYLNLLLFQVSVF